MDGIDGQSNRVEFLAHNHVDLGGPEAIVFAEPAVQEVLRLSASMFLPEQGQSDAGAEQLGGYLCPVRYRALGTAGGNSRRSNSASEISMGH